MNRFHLTGNQNQLIEDLAAVFMVKGKPVKHFPKSYKAVNDPPSMDKVLSLLSEKLPEEAHPMFEGKLIITAILFEFKNFFNPLIEIHSTNRAVIYITIGSLFSVCQQHLIDPNVAK